jgi:hypothetical protein
MGQASLKNSDDNEFLRFSGLQRLVTLRDFGSSSTLLRRLDDSPMSVQAG